MTTNNTLDKLVSESDIVFRPEKKRPRYQQPYNIYIPPYITMQENPALEDHYRHKEHHRQKRQERYKC